MQEVLADFMRLDAWDGMPENAIALAPVDARPELAALEGQTVILRDTDIQAQGRIVSQDGWWYGVLTSPIEDVPVEVVVREVA
ncbi:MAG: hypothetical protein H0U76_18965 [Ktedonobacteraceae bacterium]|nr:hypothetical protein [Ktedonobacteraceae bacterium]MBA3823807.1 hypothetical protein [Ktedonobacterales bacterium]